MAEVFLSDYGDGYTTTDANPPMTEGELFTIFFHPDPDAELLDVRAFDSHDYSVALPEIADNEITMRWRSGWGNLYVDCYYSGSTPPPPEPQTPWWLIIAMKKNNERRLKPYVRN